MRRSLLALLFLGLTGCDWLAGRPVAPPVVACWTETTQLVVRDTLGDSAGVVFVRQRLCGEPR